MYEIQLSFFLNPFMKFMFEEQNAQTVFLISIAYHTIAIIDDWIWCSSAQIVIPINSQLYGRAVFANFGMNKKNGL